MAKKDPLATAKKRGEELLKANPELAKKLAERREARESGPLASLLYGFVDACLTDETEVILKTDNGMITEITLRPRIEQMGR